MDDATNSRGESSLHSAIKKWYLAEGDRVEAKVGGFIIDILRGDLLVEIQTSNSSAIKPKLTCLLKDHKVRLVHPIATKKWILHKSASNGETLRRRRSPKKGRLSDVFGELVRIPSLFSSGNLSIEVLMSEIEEIWCDDGKGSWRRRGASIRDRRLIRVSERVLLQDKANFLRFLPENLPDPFSNRDLSKSLRMPINQSRRITYSLTRIGTIEHAGMNGRQMLFRIPQKN